MKTIQFGDATWEERFGALFRYAQVGRCVNGVTHDINNILGVIMANAELMGLEAKLDDRTRSMLEEVVNGVLRCTDLIGTLTSIAREDKISANIAEPDKIAADILRLRDYALRVDRVRLETDVADDLPTIVADTPKVLLALVYLFMNAQESVAAVDNKQVRFRAYREGEGVAFEVWDSGPALEEEAAAKAFEPFRSTKNGYHLGFGLHAARQIATLHEGTLTYDRERGFKLYLPSRNKLIDKVNTRE